jgi:hypothetical protein
MTETYIIKQTSSKKIVFFLLLFINNFTLKRFKHFMTTIRSILRILKRTRAEHESEHTIEPEYGRAAILIA